jgi:hypothetical protein
VIDAPKEAASPGNGVVQVLVRTQYLSPVEFDRVEQIEIDPGDCAVPSGAVRCPASFMVFQQPHTG